jgi:hypothetical protein
MKSSNVKEDAKWNKDVLGKYSRTRKITQLQEKDMKSIISKEKKMGIRTTPQLQIYGICTYHNNA